MKIKLRFNFKIVAAGIIGFLLGITFVILSISALNKYQPGFYKVFFEPPVFTLYEYKSRAMAGMRDDIKGIKGVRDVTVILRGGFVVIEKDDDFDATTMTKVIILIEDKWPGVDTKSITFIDDINKALK